jgi:hypothetical protein
LPQLHESARQPAMDISTRLVGRRQSIAEASPRPVTSGQLSDDNLHIPRNPSPRVEVPSIIGEMSRNFESLLSKVSDILPDGDPADLLVIRQNCATQTGSRGTATLDGRQGPCWQALPASVSLNGRP